MITNEQSEANIKARAKRYTAIKESLIPENKKRRKGFKQLLAEAIQGERVDSGYKADSTEYTSGR
jgi:hypothetical protein